MYHARDDRAAVVKESTGKITNQIVFKWHSGGVRKK